MVALIEELLLKNPSETKLPMQLFALDNTASPDEVAPVVNQPCTDGEKRFGVAGGGHMFQAVEKIMGSMMRNVIADGCEFMQAEVFAFGLLQRVHDAWDNAINTFSCQKQLADCEDRPSKINTILNSLDKADLRMLIGDVGDDEHYCALSFEELAYLPTVLEAKTTLIREHNSIPELHQSVTTRQTAVFFRAHLEERKLVSCSDDDGFTPTKYDALPPELLKQFQVFAALNTDSGLRKRVSIALTSARNWKLLMAVYAANDAYMLLGQAKPVVKKKKHKKRAEYGAPPSKHDDSAPPPAKPIDIKKFEALFLGVSEEGVFTILNMLNNNQMTVNDIGKQVDKIKARVKVMEIFVEHFSHGVDSEDVVDSQSWAELVLRHPAQLCEAKVDYIVSQCFEGCKHKVQHVC